VTVHGTVHGPFTDRSRTVHARKRAGQTFMHRVLKVLSGTDMGGTVHACSRKQTNVQVRRVRTVHAGFGPEAFTERSRRSRCWGKRAGRSVHGAFTPFTHGTVHVPPPYYVGGRGEELNVNVTAEREGA
jgi:hypothetical protein